MPWEMKICQYFIALKAKMECHLGKIKMLTYMGKSEFAVWVGFTSELTQHIASWERKANILTFLPFR